MSRGSVVLPVLPRLRAVHRVAVSFATLNKQTPFTWVQVQAGQFDKKNEETEQINSFNHLNLFLPLNHQWLSQKTVIAVKAFSSLQ
jgi:hypothetical protein